MDNSKESENTFDPSKFSSIKSVGLDAIDDLLSPAGASLLSSEKLRLTSKESEKRTSELISIDDIPSARSVPPSMNANMFFDSSLSPRSADTANVVRPVVEQKRKNASLFDLLDAADIISDSPNSTTPQDQKHFSEPMKSKSLIELPIDDQTCPEMYSIFHIDTLHENIIVIFSF